VRASILAVTSELPWPLDTGGHLRTYHLLRALTTTFDVRLVAGVLPEQRALAQELRESGIDVRPAWVKRRTRVTEGFRLLRSASRARPYVLYGRHGRREVRATISAELKRARPDILYLDHLDSFQFADLAPDVPSVLDLHNVYSLLLLREASDARHSRLTRRYLLREARLLAGVEASAVRQSSAVFSVSREEQTHFVRNGGRTVHVVPNGVDCVRYSSLLEGRSSAAPVILFIGTLSWAPNAAAARFLASEVLPQVRTQVPNATLVIVGRNPDDEVRALAKTGEVVVAANVDDILPYLSEAAVLAVPLEAGGGTRLKILEAFAAGLPVVSTAVGAEGIAAQPGRELIVAERPAFAAAVSSLLIDRQRGTEMAAFARTLVNTTYEWRTVGEAARDAIQQVLDHAARGDNRHPRNGNGKRPAPRHAFVRPGIESIERWP
jgi:glycosyltransferase involved in cell wall biosynthesis